MTINPLQILALEIKGRDKNFAKIILFHFLSPLLYTVFLFHSKTGISGPENSYTVDVQNFTRTLLMYLPRALITIRKHFYLNALTLDFLKPC